MFRTWLESSLGDLYQSAVEAFPNTTKRQHATSTIQIENVAWTPYVGVRTLFVRADALNEGRQYRPMILFKNVHYGHGPIQFRAADDGQPYRMEQISEDGGQVLVRCGCADFFYRFNYYDFIDHSLQGKKRPPYVAISNRGPVNPTESPGLCKHLMRLMESLRDQGLLVSRP